MSQFVGHEFHEVDFTQTQRPLTKPKTQQLCIKQNCTAEKQDVSRDESTKDETQNVTNILQAGKCGCLLFSLSQRGGGLTESSSEGERKRTLCSLVYALAVQSVMRTTAIVGTSLLGLAVFSEQLCFLFC